MTQLIAGTFCGLQNLETLHLEGNDIIYIDPIIFKFDLSLKYLYSNITGICCYAEITLCTPKFPDVFASCTNILYNNAVKYSVWIISLTAIAENLLAFFTLDSVSPARSIRKCSNNFNHKQLIISDMMMGLYVLALALVDTVYDGDYVTVEQLWKNGILCKMCFSFQCYPLRCL